MSKPVDQPICHSREGGNPPAFEGKICQNPFVNPSVIPAKAGIHKRFRERSPLRENRIWCQIATGVKFRDPLCGIASQSKDRGNHRHGKAPTAENIVGAKHDRSVRAKHSGSLFNILSNRLSAGMLRPYRYLWFTRGENCCNLVIVASIFGIVLI